MIQDGLKVNAVIYWCNNSVYFSRVKFVVGVIALTHQRDLGEYKRAILHFLIDRVLP